ncbi:MAG TPA: RDD family protein [Burkholderiaceae bacterium]|nr:RDD family protein [Burkholderiaceae bacterium]
MTVAVQPARAPSLRRRLACFFYEGVLLFGVVMISAYLFSSLTQQRHAMQSRHELQLFMFVVLGIYFVWFWSHGGQTLAMKTWHVRLRRAGGDRLTQARAFARFVASWIWFVPSLAVLWVLRPVDGYTVTAVMGGWVLLYAAASFLHPRRQYWHDALCGTELVEERPLPKPDAGSTSSRQGA